jgi:hypothetical protein
MKTVEPRLRLTHRHHLPIFEPVSCGPNRLRLSFLPYANRYKTIIFSIEQDEATNSEVIVLFNIGTHDEVY